MIDIVILIMMLFFVIIGYKKGLIKELITLAGSIMALLMAFVIYPAINSILKVTALYTIIYTGVFEKVQNINFGKGLQSQGNAIIENITWLPKVLTEQIRDNNNSAMYEVLGVHTLHEYISTYITNMIISMLAILITWFLIKIVLIGALKKLGNIVEHLPVISQFNQLGGGLVGALKGLLTLSIIMLIIPIIVANPNLSDIGMKLEASYFVQWIYKHNLVIWLYNYYL